MKRYLIHMIVFALTIFFVPVVHAFDIMVSPGTVKPGDAFMVKVSSLSGITEPVAEFNGSRLSFSKCGEGCYFSIAATDIKAKRGRRRLSIHSGKKVRHTYVRISSHEFPEIHLSLPQEKVDLSTEDEKRADDEAEMLKAIWHKSSEKMWESAFIRPIEGQISTEFGVKRIMNKKKESIHRGIDFRGSEGEPVMAANKGIVVISKDLFFGGNTIILDHGMGIYSVYMHLSGFAKRPGEQVEKGEVIGYVGSTGRATGPHLHFGLKVGPASVNPLSLINMKL